MNKRKVIHLALKSYDGDSLDEKTVNYISSLLSRSDLKKYINELKKLENNKKLIVSTSYENLDTKSLMKIFPNKRLIIRKDPSLLLGIKIIDNDMVYEFSLENSLDKIISYIKENYDW